MGQWEEILQLDLEVQLGWEAMVLEGQVRGGGQKG